MLLEPSPPAGFLGSLSGGLAPLRDPRYRWWFLSQLLSSAGTSTQGVGQAWLVIGLGGGSVALAVVTGALFLPALLFGAPLGALSDRYAPGRLLLVTQSAQLTLATLSCVLAATGAVNVPTLAVVALVMGCAGAVDAPARQLFVFALAGEGRVSSVISLNEISLNASRVLGPALGGAALTLSGVWLCFAFNAATFVPTLVFLLRNPDLRAPRPRATTGRRVDLRAGLRFVWTHGAVRTAVLLAVCSGAVINLNVTMPLIATDEFRASGGVFGLMMMCFGAGAVPGALLSAARPARPGAREVALLALATGTAATLCALAPTLPLLFAGLGLVGMTSILFIARANTLVLLSTDTSMRGQVMGVWAAAMPGMSPVTSLGVGFLTDHQGPRTGYGATGVLMGLVALAGLSAAVRRGRRAAAPLTPAPPTPAPLTPRPGVPAPRRGPGAPRRRR